MLSLVRANVIAQLLVLLSLPFLTRLFSPSDFGVLAIFSGLLTLIGSFSALRVDWSIPIANDKYETHSLVAWGLFSVVFISACFLLFGDYVLSQFAPIWNKIESYRSFLPLLSIGIILGGSKQILESCHIRSNKLEHLGRARIGQSLINLSLCLILGILGLGADGLIIALICGLLSGLVVVYYFRPQNALSASAFYAGTMITTLRSYWSELAYSSLASTVNRLSQSAFPLLLAIHFDAKSVGLFALTHRLAIAPTALLTNAISQSFWAEVANLIKDRPIEAYTLYIKNTKRLLAILALVLIVLVIIAALLDDILGKSQWSGSGAVLMAVTPMLAGQIVVSPLSHLIAHRKQKWQFIWDIFRCSLIICVLLITPIFSFNLIGTLTVVSVMSLIMYCLLFYLNLVAYRGKII